MSAKDHPVYSTQHGKMCRQCGKPVASCVCRAAPSPLGRGPIRVGRETKGRKGKGVTVVSGIPLGGEELAALARQLKQKCGAGGTVRAGVIEIQGDHRDLLVAELDRLGWKAKRAGG
jgi:translation initiation factor 1